MNEVLTKAAAQALIQALTGGQTPKPGETIVFKPGDQNEDDGWVFDVPSSSSIYFSVKEKFGDAIGDGVVDDTAAIQATIDYVELLGGGVVFLPEGTYLCSQLRMKSYVTLAGTGSSSVIKQKSSTNGSLIVLDNVNVEWIVIRDLMLDGNKANQTTTNHGIYLDNTSGSWTTNDQHHLVENVHIVSFTGSGISKDTDVREARFVNLWISQCDRWAIETESAGGTDNWHINITSEGCTLGGFRLNGWSDFWGFCKAFGSAANGFDMEANGLTITNCWAQENAGHGFKFDDDNCTRIVGSSLVADSNNLVGFYFDKAIACVLENCAAFQSAALLYDHNYGVQFKSNSSLNSISCVLTTSAAFDTAPYDTAFIGSNKLTDVERILGSYSNLGAGVSGGDEHYNFGQSGNPAASNARFTLKSETVGGVAQGRIEAWDGTTTQQYIVFDWANGVVDFGGGTTFPRMPVYADGTRPAANTLPSGSFFWNSDDNFMNVSDGANWRDPTGAVT